ncbi:helix-turn-helix transcriptional regulator [Brevundimonas diminuta]|uniref:helix-turn-helix transcriptional regulator n=1 Tax=Brevundimonas diminuta TaxID=293 RepID=UPI00320B8A18
MTKILAWRKSAGLTQADLARRLGIRARSHISALESGHERVSAEQAIAIDRLSHGQVTVAELRPDLHDVRVIHPEGP